MTRPDPSRAPEMQAGREPGEAEERAHNDLVALRIAALQADVARLTEKRDEALALAEGPSTLLDLARGAVERGFQLNAAETRIAALEAALKPFADEAERYDPDEGDSHYVAWASDFLIGSLRRARAALTPDPGSALAEGLPEGVTAKTVYVARNGKEHDDPRGALEANEDIARAEAANALLQAGATVWEAARAWSRWPQHEPPPILKQITKDTPLIISHWQCRDEPGYRVISFQDDAYHIYVGGDAGSWSGPYGNRMPIGDLAAYVENTLRKHPELAVPPPPAEPPRQALAAARQEGGER